MPLPKQFDTAQARYASAGEIRNGACGYVFRVTDEKGAEFALKLIDVANVDSAKIKRFRNEMQFCLRPVHKNIVQALDDGFVEMGGSKWPFYVMPWYDGTLRDLIRQPLSTAEVLPVFGQILDGMEAAHKYVRCHRDIKPENILCGKGTVVIADFGIAHFEDDMLATIIETRPADKLANFAYRAPEQCERGKPVDARADIFALGMILNEMFTQRLPIGSGYKNIETIATDYGFLDPVVDAMIQNDPVKRPQTIDDVRNQIRARGELAAKKKQIVTIKTTKPDVSEIDDPVFRQEVAIVGYDYEPQHQQFILKLNMKVPQLWASYFTNLTGVKEWKHVRPSAFDIRGDTVKVPCYGDDGQKIIDLFKTYAVDATNTYMTRIKRDHAKQEAEKQEALRNRIEMEQKRLATIKDLKL